MARVLYAIYLGILLCLFIVFLVWILTTDEKPSKRSIPRNIDISVSHPDNLYDARVVRVRYILKE